MADVNEYRVDAGALALSVRDHPGGDPPIVALHGLASNARWWDLVAARLGGSHRLLALDQRGHGLADKPETGYSFDECVADLHAALRTLGIGEAVIAGHSWGASVALAYAVAHPASTLGVVCVDGGVTDLRAVFGSDWARAEAAMRPPDLVGITAEQLRHWIELSPLTDSSDVDTGFQIVMGNFESSEGGGLRPRLRVERHMQIAKALYEMDVSAALAEIEAPVLLVMAALGRGHEASGERMLDVKRRSVRDALSHLGDHGAVVWIDGEHDLPVQRPAEVANALGAFVDSLPHGAAAG